MSRFRLPLLAAILLIGIIVGRSWWNRYVTSLAAEAHPPTPPPAHVQSQSENWHYFQSDKDRNIVEIEARKISQAKDSTEIELEGVHLKIFNKDSSKYDDVRSEKAKFNTRDGVLVSDGDVEITLSVPDNGPPKTRLLKIKSSGVRYESKTGKATTDREASFTFDKGDGRSLGAVYEPNAHELVMKSQVELHWRGEAKAKDMTVQAGELHYKENEGKVYLSPWSRLVRDTLTLNATDSVVTVTSKGQIQKVEAKQAQGTDALPEKKVDYAADMLYMNFSDDGEINSIDGFNNAKVVNTSKANQTTITADKVNMVFATDSGSTLQRAVANGKAVVEAKPVPQPNVLAADTRILKSETVEMSMRADGKDIDKVTTPTPGSVEFLPNKPASKHRLMQGERLDIQYGEANVIQTFKSVNVQTRTENEPKKGQKTAPPSLTWSKDLVATFDPKTGDMSKLEQWNDFRYEEGDRKALATKATLEQASDIITLDGKAKVWDGTGSNAADKIVMLQKSDETRCEGNVVSLRLPDKTKQDNNSLLAPDEPLQGKADKMVSRENNAKIHYEGKAILWQGVNRLQADKIDIDRDEGIIKADGQVISQFIEKQKDNPATAVDPKKAAVGAPVVTASTNSAPVPPKKKDDSAPVYTVIKAPNMVYDDDTRMAHYTGGVTLNRTGLDVKSSELRAFLKEENTGDSSLDHAFADGKVEILQRTPERTRTGTGQHGEYYVTDGKIFISGDNPVLVDSIRGTTRGRQMTYYSNDDRLIVDGEVPAVKKPAFTELKRKAHKGPK